MSGGENVKGQRIERGRWTHAKRRKGVCTKRQRTEDGDNLATSQHTSKRAWGAVEDSRIGYTELLMARSNKEVKIYVEGCDSCQ